MSSSGGNLSRKGRNAQDLQVLLCHSWFTAEKTAINMYEPLRNKRTRKGYGNLFVQLVFNGKVNWISSCIETGAGFFLVNTA